MKIHIELTENDLKELVLKEITKQAGEFAGEIKLSDISIETKSRQNYKSEWETGAGFRAIYEASIT